MTQGVPAAKKIKFGNTQVGSSDYLLPSSHSKEHQPAAALSHEAGPSSSASATSPGEKSTQLGLAQTSYPLQQIPTLSQPRTEPQSQMEPQTPSGFQGVELEQLEPHPPPEATRPTRSHRLPMRFRDELPVPPHNVPQPPPSTLPRVILHVFDSFQTSLNRFGISREYRHRPTYDPDAFVSVDQLSNVRPDKDLESSSSFEVASSPKPPPWPWQNMSIWRLMSWKLTGSRHKSEAEVTRLVKEVLMAEDFSVEDLQGFHAHTEIKRFDTSEAALDPNDVFQRDGWKESAVDISVPMREPNPKGNGQSFTIPGFQYRPLTAIIRSVFSEPASKWFHLTPFKRFWKSFITGREQRLYDELYTSDAWIKAHDDLQKQGRNDSCDLEKVIAGLMFWSDSTHLAQFGNASAWPVYLYFGNQSKYVRACPTSAACHLIALIPSVSVSGSLTVLVMLTIPR